MTQRDCVVVSTDGLSCDSVLFPVTGTLEETILVCVAQSEPIYQHEQFQSYHESRATTIASAYVSGVSLTNGVL